MRNNRPVQSCNKQFKVTHKLKKKKSSSGIDYYYYYRKYPDILNRKISVKQSLFRQNRYSESIIDKSVLISDHMRNSDNHHRRFNTQMSGQKYCFLSFLFLRDIHVTADPI